MRLRLLLAFGVVLLCSAFQSTGFAGCGGSGPPPADLPPSDEMGCFTDAECVGDPCRMFACVTGTCIDRGVLDNDLDGVAGGSCGDDCDDFDRTRFPGATEFCDGIDQDCDGDIDEEATPNVMTWSVFLSDPFPSMSVLGDGLVVAARLDTGTGLQLALIDRFGSSTGSLTALEDTPILEHRLIPRTDGATLVTATATGIIGLRVSSTGALPEFEIATEGTPSHLGATTYGDDQVAVAWIEDDGGMLVWTTQYPTTTASEFGVPTQPPEGPVDVASDGSRVVIAFTPNQVYFADPFDSVVPEVRDVGVDRVLAYAPLASSDGEVIALLRDAFDHAITGLTVTSPVGRSPAPSVRDTTMRGRVDTLGDRIVVTRFSDGSSSIAGTTISLLDSAFLPISSVDPSMTGSFGGTASSWDVALHPDFTAVITAFDGSLLGVTLGCGL